MQGFWFTELFEWLSADHGHDLAESVFDRCILPSGGDYQVHESYDSAEFWQLVAEIARSTRIPAEPLLLEYGRYVLPGLLKRGRNWLPDVKGTLALLRRLAELSETHGDQLAELGFPRIRLSVVQPGQVVLDYQALSPDVRLARALLRAAGAHFEETLTIETLQVEHSRVAASFRITHSTVTHPLTPQ